jgi:hypothetical protein
MNSLKRSEERSPLIQRDSGDASAASQTSSTQSVSDEERNGPKGEVEELSTSRGAMIVGSVGFLIFLQGKTYISFLFFVRCRAVKLYRKSALHVKISRTTQCSGGPLLFPLFLRSNCEMVM